MSIALITGARGFIGRHLSLALYKRGIQVCGIGHGAWTDSDRSAWGVASWLNGEVSKRNLDFVLDQVGDPDLVFHLAGGSAVGPSLTAPEEDFRRSVLSTAELLEWARSAAPKARLVLSSSAAVYGAGHSSAIGEDDALSPYSPYGSHKRIAEELFSSYGRNFGLNVATVRLFSVYGTELKKQLLWDACGRLAIDAMRLTLGGTGMELRDWLHVTDAAAVLQLGAGRACPAGYTVNGGTGLAVSVRQIAEQLCFAWGAETELSFTGQSRRGDPQYLVANVAQATQLSFKPQIAWQEGVTDYVTWFKRVTAQVTA